MKQTAPQPKLGKLDWSKNGVLGVRDGVIVELPRAEGEKLVMDALLRMAVSLARKQEARR